MISADAKRLGVPRRIPVHVGAHGFPAAVGGVDVEAFCEDWVVEDRWWTGRPVRRRYFELGMADGRDITVFCELGRARWFLQRA